MPRNAYRLELTRCDIAGGDTGGLPTSLLDAIEADGGLWWASEGYTRPDEIVAKARAVGARALRLDVRELSLLESLPQVRYLHLRSDGRRPPLDPIASLRGLRALIIETGGLRGELDLLSFPDLRWLRLGLGGKGGQAMLPVMAVGHPALEWLSVSETKANTATDIVAGFPRLRTLHVNMADCLSELGPLASVMPDLRTVGLMLTPVRTLNGLVGLEGLEILNIFGGSVTDLGPLHEMRQLRYARLLLAHLKSLEPLRGHPALRMLDLTIEPEVAVLRSIPGLVALGRKKTFDGPFPWPDPMVVAKDHPMRIEWFRAMRE